MLGLCESPLVRYISHVLRGFVAPSFSSDSNSKKGFFRVGKLFQSSFSFSFVVSFFISVIKDLAGLNFFFGLEDSFGLEHPRINDVQKFPLCLL